MSNLDTVNGCLRPVCDLPYCLVVSLRGDTTSREEEVKADDVFHDCCF